MEERERQKFARIYTRAAEVVAKGRNWFCDDHHAPACCAIQEVIWDTEVKGHPIPAGLDPLVDKARYLFNGVFKPVDENEGDPYFGVFWDSDRESAPREFIASLERTQTARVLALSLVALLAESDELEDLVANKKQHEEQVQ